MDNSTDASVQAVAALDEPTRRRLYDHVVAASPRRSAGTRRPPRSDSRAPRPRSTSTSSPRKACSRSCYERRTGRTGPGAGRPAKLYRRSDRQIEISFPERQYDVAGHLLAAAVEDAESSGDSPRRALERRAGLYGESVGRAARNHPGTPLSQVLEAHGFEPRENGSAIDLANCPFHALAKDHASLVCNMTLSLVGGVLAGFGDSGLRAVLDPNPAHCCVRLTRIGFEGGEG